MTRAKPISPTQSQAQASKSRYRPEIDGLRAFAVIAVIINHFNKDVLPGGYLGVDIFFVISGYVITSSLYGRQSKDFKDFLGGFYERRIKRLVPALSVFVLITSIAICLFNQNPGLLLRTGLASLFGLSNLYLLKQSTDYFAQSTELNVFTHTWSLGVEEQFYVLFPFIIWFSGFGRQTKNGARNLFVVVGILTIASLIGFFYWHQANQSAAYFLMPSRFWEMAAGCLIFIGFQKRAAVEQFLEKAPPLLILGSIVGVMYLPMSLASVSTVAVVILSSVLIASLKEQTATFRVFTNTKVVYIGLISYSLYLWHWGVLSISRWTIGIHWWSIPFQVALMLGLAVASYRWIETPLRKGNWFGKRWKTLVVGGLMTGSVSILITGAAKSKVHAHLFLGKQTEIVDIELIHNQKIADTQISVNNCKQVSSQSITNCIAPPLKSSAPRILLVGDSHASIWYPVLDALRKSYGIGIYTHIAGWNPPAQMYPPLRYVQGDFGRAEWTKINYYQERMVERFVHDSRPGDIVILSSRMGGHFQDYNSKKYLLEDWRTGLTHSGALDLYLREVAKFAENANRRGIKTFLILPIPRIDVPNITLCQHEWYRPAKVAHANCSRRDDYRQIVKKARDFGLEKNSVHLFQVDSSLLQNAEQTYLDDNHLSPSGVMKFLDQFKVTLGLR